MGKYAGKVNNYHKGNSMAHKDLYVKLDNANVRVIMHDRFN